MGSQPGKQRFHYDFYWADKEECSGLIREVWSRLGGNNRMDKVINNLSTYATCLKRWSCH